MQKSHWYKWATALLFATMATGSAFAAQKQIVRPSGTAPGGNFSPGILIEGTLYISGQASDLTAFHGLPGLAAHVLAKPFGMDSLVRRVRTILDERPAREDAPAPSPGIKWEAGTGQEAPPANPSEA